MRYVARQPIFDRSEQVMGYELFFRSGWENYFTGSDRESASRETLDSTLLMGLGGLCEGHKVFLNCSRDTLLKDYVGLLPQQWAVAEILETVPPDAEVEHACNHLRERGFTIALDDYVMGDARQPLLPLADIIKIDVKDVSPQNYKKMVKEFEGYGIRALAEKVESREEFRAAMDAGFDYFQGYFFQKPEVLSTREIPALKYRYLRILHEIHKPTIDFQAVEQLIKGELSLCFRLLRYLNSAAFFFRGGITSIRHALTMLGEEQLRKWISLVVVVGAAQESCGALVRSALVRARFCELLSHKANRNPTYLFLMGLLSHIDAILGTPMADILRQLPLSDDVKAALLRQASRLSQVYDLVLAYETANWTWCADLASGLHCTEREIAGFYFDAVQWARHITTF